MLKFLKWTVAFAVTLGLVCVFVHPHRCAVVIESTLEGLAGGLMAGLVLAFSKLDRLQHQERFTLKRATCLMRHEVCAGLVGGLLVGLALVAIIQ